MSRVRLVRIFWLGAAALLVVAALVAIVALLRGELTETDARILLTLGALFVVGATGLAGLALVDSGQYAAFGKVVGSLAPVEFAILASWIWVDPGTTHEKIGSTTILLVVGQLALTTQLLLLAGRRLRPLVALTGALLTVAVGGTIAALWSEPEDTTFAKVLAATWILAGLGWFLLPVLQRYTAAGGPTGERVLAELDGVELVATRARVPDTVDARLERGERLVLRRTR